MTILKDLKNRWNKTKHQQLIKDFHKFLIKAHSLNINNEQFYKSIFPILFHDMREQAFTDDEIDEVLVTASFKSGQVVQFKDFGR